MPDFSYTNTNNVLIDFLSGKLNADHAAENYAYVMMQEKPHLDEASVDVQANGAIRSAAAGNFDATLEVVRDEFGAVSSVGGVDVLGAVGPSKPIGSVAERNPYTEYLRQIGLLDPGTEGYNPADLYEESLYDPIERLYGLQGRFAATTKTGPGDVIPYMTSRAKGFRDDPGSIYAGAGDILGRLLSMGRQKRRDLGFSFSPTYPESMGGEPLESEVKALDQFNLLNMALRPTMGFSGAQRIARRLPTEKKVWRREQAVPKAAERPFLNWLSDKYGMDIFS